MARRRQSSGTTAAVASSTNGAARPRQQTKVPLPANVTHLEASTAEPHPPPAPARRQSSRNLSSHASTNPNANPDVVDGITALRASPDGVGIAGVDDSALKPGGDASSGEVVGTAPTDATPAAPNAITENGSIDVPAEAHGQSQGAADKRTRKPKNQQRTSQTLAPASETAAPGVTEQYPSKNKRKRGANEHVKVDSAAADNGTITNAVSAAATASAGPAVDKDVGVTVDPEAEEDAAVECEDEVKEALSRPPPVNSNYLPLPWKGRIGYVRALPCYPRSAPYANIASIGLPEHIPTQR